MSKKEYPEWDKEEFEYRGYTYIKVNGDKTYYYKCKTNLVKTAIWETISRLDYETANSNLTKST